ncbi:MAG TPA: hypothetical protein VFC23_14670 [Thermoanaerobaculia bacterium]|nr:hypothetical protein [Thermoanaerobaculia bacterium]
MPDHRLQLLSGPLLVARQGILAILEQLALHQDPLQGGPQRLGRGQERSLVLVRAEETLPVAKHSVRVDASHSFSFLPSFVKRWLVLVPG